MPLGLSLRHIPREDGPGCFRRRVPGRRLSPTATPGASGPLCDLLTDTVFCIIYIFSFSLSFLIIYSINPFFLADSSCIYKAKSNTAKCSSLYKLNANVLFMWNEERKKELNCCLPSAQPEVRQPNSAAPPRPGC